jgi:cysteine desulfurase
MSARPGVYLDYNATAPVRASVADAMLRALVAPGNASSVHGFGRAARQLVEEARERVAALVGAAPDGVVFTSGGTEANIAALAGFPGRRILASAIEHASVLGAKVDATIPVDRRGVVDLEALERLLAEDERPALVAVMLANNETGVIQPLREVAAVARGYRAVVHGDAVQAAGKIDVNIAALGIDTLSLSAHKLGGPQGVGALVLADPAADMAPLLMGGGQERRRRAGTENVPGIVGFGVAAGEALVGLADGARLGRLRDRLESEAAARVAGLTVFGAQAERVPNTSCLGVAGVSAQTLLMALDLAGIAVSSGAACSSGKVAPSHVLTAMGVEVASAIRVSLGWASAEADVERFVDAFAEVCGRLARDSLVGERLTV